MDKLWYYTIGARQQRGPISENELCARIQSGEVAPSELAWTDGMAGWTAIGTLSEFQSFIPPTPNFPSSAPSYVASVPSFGGWLAFVGILNVVGGALLTVTCIGIPMGILMILSGTALLGAKSALEKMGETPPEFAPALAKFRTYFVLTGVIFLLNMLGFLLVFINMSGMAIALSRMAEQFK